MNLFLIVNRNLLKNKKFAILLNSYVFF